MNFRLYEFMIRFLVVGNGRVLTLDFNERFENRVHRHYEGPIEDRDTAIVVIVMLVIGARIRGGEAYSARCLRNSGYEHGGTTLPLVELVTTDQYNENDGIG